MAGISSVLQEMKKCLNSTPRIDSRLDLKLKKTSKENKIGLQKLPRTLKRQKNVKKRQKNVKKRQKNVKKIKSGFKSCREL
jgi:hypothetical protein